MLTFPVLPQLSEMVSLHFQTSRLCKQRGRTAMVRADIVYTHIHVYTHPFSLTHTQTHTHVNTHMLTCTTAHTEYVCMYTHTHIPLTITHLSGTNEPFKLQDEISNKNSILQMVIFMTHHIEEHNSTACMYSVWYMCQTYHWE